MSRSSLFANVVVAPVVLLTLAVTAPGWPTAGFGLAWMLFAAAGPEPFLKLLDQVARRCFPTPCP